MPLHGALRGMDRFPLKAQRHKRTPDRILAMIVLMSRIYDKPDDSVADEIVDLYLE